MRRIFVIGISALATGAMFAAGMPPGDVQILGWLCFVPLLMSLHGARLVYVILAPLGALLFAAYLTTTGSLYSWANLEGDAAWHYAGFMLYALALTPAFIAASVLRNRSSLNVVLVAAAFVAAESLLLVYLPAHLALSQYRSPIALSAASLVGIWGVSFGLWLFQTWLSSYLQTLREPKSIRWPLAAPAVLVWLGVSLWEHEEPRSPKTEMGALQSGMARVGVIQTLEPDFERLAAWNIEAKRAGASLVVWPELSAAGIAAGGRTERLVELSRDPAQPAFVTTFPDGSKPKPYNAAVLFFAGSQSEPYFKRKPFAGEAQDHAAGTLPASARLENLAVGLNICFDSCFPHLLRDTSRLEGVRIVALPCMGPESPYGVVQAIHGAFTPFRSAELGVPIARGETSAFAMITDAQGRIVAQAPPGFQGFLLGDISLEPRWTLVRVLGDWFLYLSWLAVAYWTVRSLYSARRKLKSAQPEDLASTAPSGAKS